MHWIVHAWVMDYKLISDLWFVSIKLIFILKTMDKFESFYVIYKKFSLWQSETLRNIFRSRFEVSPIKFWSSLLCAISFKPPLCLSLNKISRRKMISNYTIWNINIARGITSKLFSLFRKYKRAGMASFKLLSNFGQQQNLQKRDSLGGTNSNPQHELLERLSMRTLGNKNIKNDHKPPSSQL